MTIEKGSCAIGIIFVFGYVYILVGWFYSAFSILDKIALPKWGVKPTLNAEQLRYS